MTSLQSVLSHTVTFPSAFVSTDLTASDGHLSSAPAPRPCDSAPFVHPRPLLTPTVSRQAQPVRTAAGPGPVSWSLCSGSNREEAWGMCECSQTETSLSEPFPENSQFPQLCFWRCPQWVWYCKVSSTGGRLPPTTTPPWRPSACATLWSRCVVAAPHKSSRWSGWQQAAETPACGEAGATPAARCWTTRKSQHTAFSRCREHSKSPRRSIWE